MKRSKTVGGKLVAGFVAVLALTAVVGWAGLAATGRANHGVLTETIRTGSVSAQQIVASAHEQSVGMDQIAHAMRDVHTSTVQFVAGAQQSQAAAEGLNDLAGQLLSLTEKYTV
jgi:methyl-accepting chemotaxis protein